MLNSYVLYHGRLGEGYEMNRLLYPTHISPLNCQSVWSYDKILIDHMLQL